MILDDDEGPSSEELLDSLRQAFRRCGFLPDLPLGALHPLASMGPRLKTLRELSGWTISEIAERTGVRLDVLTAFEDGDPAAADVLTRFDLESLASACCGSLADLLEPEPSTAQPSPDSILMGSSGCFIDPTG